MKNGLPAEHLSPGSNPPTFFENHPTPPIHPPPARRPTHPKPTRTWPKSVKTKSPACVWPMTRGEATTEGTRFNAPREVQREVLRTLHELCYSQIFLIWSTTPPFLRTISPPLHPTTLAGLGCPPLLFLCPQSGFT